MGVAKGTVMGVGAVIGAVVSQTVAVTGITYVDWVLGAFLGTVAGDAVGKLFGRPIALGRGPAMLKGLIAAGGGAASLHFGTGFVEWAAITGGTAIVSDILM